MTLVPAVLTLTGNPRHVVSPTGGTAGTRTERASCPPVGG
jgi:hypothetical protein